MPGGAFRKRTGFDRALAALLSLGRPIFAIAIVAFGVETLVCARTVSHPLGPGYAGLPVIPWLPAIPWVAYLFGGIWLACGAGLLLKRTAGPAAKTIGWLLFLCAVIIELPRNLAKFGDMGLRTVVLEPVALASLAWLLPGLNRTPGVLERLSRYLVALSLIVFGVDHFLALAFIASLIPAWIPSHGFWVAFFGVAFIAAGVSIGLSLKDRWGAAGIGLMFGTWVVTLHLPRVLGLYGIPGAPHNPDEWSSLFIAVGLFGGFWALASTLDPSRAAEAASEEV